MAENKPTNMKIRVLRPFAQPGREFVVGKEYELPAADAQQIIAIDREKPLAEEVGGARSPAPTSARPVTPQ